MASPSQTGIETRSDADPASGVVITTPPAKRETWRGMRLERKLSLRQVEDQVDINRGLISRIERGFGPTPGQARRLLAFYEGGPS